MNFVRVVMWTDSETVLKWILDTKTRFKTFIHNRLATIHELTSVDEWRYVPTAFNPADDLSHGLEPGDEKWKRYLSGPEFLQRSESEWPEQRYLNNRKTEAVINALVNERATINDKPVFDWALKIAEKRSEWCQKVRRIAMLMKFIMTWKENRKGNIPVTKYVPSLGDMQKAQNCLIKGMQPKAFPKEVEMINKQRKSEQKQELCIQSSLLMSLNPFVDSAGLLRVGGRIANATHVSYELKHPAILPKSDENTKALIREEHVNQGHAGTNHVYSSLSQKYWIISERKIVNEVIHHCINCQRMLRQPGNQKMADLPTERVNVCNPFEVTACDVFGPMTVKHGRRGTQKRWVLLFTCMTTRAVHFELLRDMTSSTFINAVVRFHARRPGLRNLFSDNGTNIRGGSECNHRSASRVEQRNGDSIVTKRN